MQRFRAVLLAFGLVALLVGLGAGTLVSQANQERDDLLRVAGVSRVGAVEDYAERGRAVALIASHSAAFAAFYRAAGDREDLIAGRTGDPELMSRVHMALTDLERLFPDSVASASFIDRSGAENARTIGRSAVAPADLDPDRTDAVYFDRAFGLLFDKVYQSPPYRSESTGEWVISHAAKVDVGSGVAPALVGFEITLESFRLALYSDDPTHRVRVVDLLDGRVIIDSGRPQDVGATLGDPRDRSLRWVQTAANGEIHSGSGQRHLVRIVTPRRDVATSWAVVVSTDARAGFFATPLAAGPVGLVVVGCLFLGMSTWGHLRHNRWMYRAARRDDLTGLLNRQAAREAAQGLLGRGELMAVALIDLDRFKLVNDSLGHHAGDQLLAVLGARLDAATRDPGDVVARLGGDEFVVLARGVKDEEGARRLCARLTGAIADPVMVEGVEVSVGVSIGVALMTEPGIDYGTLLQRADIAMYDAKARRTGWQVYHQGLACSDRAGLALDAQLRRAVAEDELVVHFQPSYHIGSGGVAGVEALVRWQHPDRGLLAPGEFVPAAEATGMITSITGVVLTLVLDQLADWRRAQIEVCASVNISAYDVNDTAFARRVEAELASRGLPGSCLVVEVTETALVADPQAAARVLAELARLGVGIAIDDFGTGYASLFYLRQFPVTVLKLDRSLVQGLTVSPTDAALVHWTIEMAHALGLSCVAEGVEDAATLRELELLGCDQAQGFYLRVPGPVGTLPDLRVNRATGSGPSSFARGTSPV